MSADTRLYQRAILAQRGERTGAAAEHRHEQTRLGLLQPLEMTQQLVDPDRHLVAEGRRHGMLAVRAAAIGISALRSARSAIAARVSPIRRKKIRAPCAEAADHRSA